MALPLRVKLAFISLLLAAGLNGCGWFGSTAAPAPQAEAETPTAGAPLPGTPLAVEKLQRPQKSAPTDVEILWEIPQQPVDGFVIRYGFSRSGLDKTVKVKAMDIEKIDDPVHGPVIRYLLKDIPSDKRIYITVSAYSGDKESDASGMFEVAPAI